MPDLTDQQLDQIEARANTDHRPMWIDILLDDAPVHAGAVKYTPDTEGRGSCGTWAVDIADWIRAVLVDNAALIAEVRRHRNTIAAVDHIHARLIVQDDHGTDYPICDACFTSWPCPTHTALHPEENHHA